MARSSSPPPSSTQELEGRRVLVAGASSGIGHACALLCAERGAQVLAVARRGNLLDELARRDTQRIAVLQADLSQEAQRRTVAEHALEILGGLDALVYTAGWAPLRDVAEYDAETWRHLLEVNLIGAARLFALCRAMLAHSPSPTFLVTSSHSVPRPWPGLVSYAASKAALETLAEGLRHEEPWMRVVCYVVHPTATGFADSWDPSRAAQAMERWDREGLLRGKLREPREIAEELVCHLAPVDPMQQPGGSLAQREPTEALRSSSHSAEGPS